MRLLISSHKSVCAARPAGPRQEKLFNAECLHKKTLPFTLHNRSTQPRRCVNLEYRYISARDSSSDISSHVAIPAPHRAPPPISKRASAAEMRSRGVGSSCGDSRAPLDPASHPSMGKCPARIASRRVERVGHPTLWFLQRNLRPMPQCTCALVEITNLSATISNSPWFGWRSYTRGTMLRGLTKRQARQHNRWRCGGTIRRLPCDSARGY